MGTIIDWPQFPGSSYYIDIMQMQLLGMLSLISDWPQCLEPRYSIDIMQRKLLGMMSSIIDWPQFLGPNTILLSYRGNYWE